MRILCIVSCKFVARLQKKLQRVRGPGRCGGSPLAPWLLRAGEPGKTGGGLLDHPGAGGCQLCCGAAGAGNTGLVVGMPLARSQCRMAGILCSSAYGTSGAGCLAGGWKGSRVSGRTQPHPLPLSSSRWGHDPRRPPGQAPTTSWSPSSGPGRCLTAGVSVLNGHPPSYLHLHREGPREQE